jgi:hypothetical protein
MAHKKTHSKSKSDTAQHPSPSEALETKLLVRFGFELAREVGIEKVLVLSELVRDRKLVEKHRETESLIWVVDSEPSEKGGAHEHFVVMPSSGSDRLSQLTMGLIVAVLQGVVEVSESVVCLTGLAGSKRLDNLLIANPYRDFPWFSRHHLGDSLPVVASLREFIRLLEIALQFSTEGREGKPIGTTFVLGDPNELEPFLRPLILNPLQGHARKMRSIHDPEFLETMRELSALDGAFVIGLRGVVEIAGTYLDAPITKEVRVAGGLGSRHLAAAAITAKTDSTSVVISESSGRISIFVCGEEVMSLEGRSTGS